MQWLFAYTMAQRYGLNFRCEPWIGERIFALPSYERPEPGAHVERCLNEIELVNANDTDLRGVTLFRGYAQMQLSMCYTKRQAQAWLKLQPEIEEACVASVAADGGETAVVCHRRVGDYIGYGYPVVSLQSYAEAARRFGLRWDDPQVAILSEEDPTPAIGLPSDMAFMPDFYRMMKAPTLLRGNSSFSWLAALLGHGLVLSPVIAGLEGGKVHDCQFVAGNHPRFANLPFVEDLYVAP